MRSLSELTMADVELIRVAVQETFPGLSGEWDEQTRLVRCFYGHRTLPLSFSVIFGKSHGSFIGQIRVGDTAVDLPPKGDLYELFDEIKALARYQYETAVMLVAVLDHAYVQRLFQGMFNNPTITAPGGEA